MSNKEPLKYLFTAVYKDGSVFEQPADDVSAQDDNRSAFFDVKQDELIAFVLKGDGHEYGVDLRDGHFEIDGVPFMMHEEEELPAMRLIFFRQHTHTFRQSDLAEIAHDKVYRLGWQLTRGDGSNYQRVMQFK